MAEENNQSVESTVREIRRKTRTPDLRSGAGKVLCGGETAHRAGRLARGREDRRAVSP